AHSAASLEPFMKETWADETQSLEECLLRHWQMYNNLMAQRFQIADEDVLRPTKVSDLTYQIECEAHAKLTAE
ncbi:TetR/AcrR family transcriptional regulator, partial [Vibrio sp. M260118]